MSPRALPSQGVDGTGGESAHEHDFFRGASRQSVRRASDAASDPQTTQQRIISRHYIEAPRALPRAVARADAAR